MCVVSVMTGASPWEAGAVALIESSINGVWFMFCTNYGVNPSNKQKIQRLKIP